MRQEEFDTLINNYRDKIESGILIFARDLYMVVTFLGVAILIIERVI